MRLSLLVRGGALAGRALVISRLPFVIGRAEDCNLRASSGQISKRHAELLLRDGRLWVRDLGSTNGTLVNGELVRNHEVALHDGSTLEIGPLDFLVRLTGAQACPGKWPSFPANPPPSDDPTEEGPAQGKEDTTTDAAQPPAKPEAADTSKTAGNLLKSYFRRPREQWG